MQISVLVQPNVKNVGSKSRRHPEGNPNTSVKTFGRTEDNDLAQFRLIVEFFS